MARRELRVFFDRQRLHSLIVGEMRMRHIPFNLQGTDYIRGAIYGMIDHPEYSVEDAIRRAWEMTNIPANCTSYEDVIDSIYYCFEARVDIDPYIDAQTEYDMVETMLKSLTKSVKYSFYRTVACDFLRDTGVAVGSIEYELLKDMLFKKLVADESTRQCTYDYAYRKAFLREPTEKLERTVAEIHQYTDKVTNGKTAYEWVLKALDEIYDNAESAIN